MTERATATEAELRRAIKVLTALGYEPCIVFEGGVVRVQPAKQPASKPPEEKAGIDFSGIEL
ncbi:MAG: hypothetical protein AAF225_08130 [Pseudomonadota bacterium]